MADAADKLCGPDGTSPLLTRLRCSAPRSESPGSAACTLMSRTPCARSMSSSSTAMSTPPRSGSTRRSGSRCEVVAQYLGERLTTVLDHYVRAGEDALRDSVTKLAAL